jgi:uncharacterized protein DUF6893
MLKALVVGIAIVGFVTMFPDIKRYIKISTM